MNVLKIIPAQPHDIVFYAKQKDNDVYAYIFYPESNMQYQIRLSVPFQDFRDSSRLIDHLQQNSPVVTYDRAVQVAFGSLQLSFSTRGAAKRRITPTLIDNTQFFINN
ncbi:hypothetical protein TetV_541 [Tetraselmis virus 1]|uniref:Uncharacterized protein n=1 Tax=Tetraselmis virus 1 TaxID=2060617 RepID=A0A2P0VNZ6_9VIRU|nr:hypothetical protein QJ968_gp513 [Tetraselmis virus 1]AUF82623.1 hypothetical protein TetV_541 [Tetraselmis virus 1]